ncbi:hypothetical protein SEA_ZENTIME222_57 [Mycobacterium phage ZenTime222]|nr:hypothetical protein SEA_ZENTIME222_57 [Mycobacterium phage ZenTime222]
MRDLETRIAEVIRPWLRRKREAEELAGEIVAVVRPRIETVEQLDALPEGAVVRSDDGGVYVKDHRYTQAGEPWWPAGYDVECGSESISLPARVLYLPEATDADPS